MCSDNSRLLLLLTIYSFWATEVSSVSDVLIKKEDSFNKNLGDYIENTIRSPDPWFEQTEDRHTPSLENNPENISTHITNITPKVRQASLYGPILPHKAGTLSNGSEESAIGKSQTYSQGGDTSKLSGSSVVSGSSSYKHGSTYDSDEPKKYLSKRQKRGLGLLLGLGAMMLNHHHHSHHHHHHPYHYHYNHLDQIMPIPVAPPVPMAAPVYPPPVYPPPDNPSRRKVRPSSTDQLRVVLPPGYVEEPCCLTNN